MPTTSNIKSIVNLPKWRQLANPLFSFNNNKTSLIEDMRNNIDRHPLVYALETPSSFFWYNVKGDGTGRVRSFSFAGNDSLGGVFMPSRGPRGTIGAGATTTSFTLSTALPDFVNANQLANRGDGQGFKVRVIGNAAGSSGKTEERYIVANTWSASKQPTIFLDSALSFTPANGDAYEFLSGKVYLMTTPSQAGSFGTYDIATGAIVSTLSTAVIPANPTSVALIGLDELHVPYDRNPGEGYFGNLIATASGAASITGQAAGGDAGVITNQFRNHQIRIVQDTAIPTATGQRRLITFHTAGPSPVYSVSAWTVTPSTTATFVIENFSDYIIAFFSGASTVFTYKISTNTWDSSVTFPIFFGQNFNSGLMAAHLFSIENDVNKNMRQSFIRVFFGSGFSDIVAEIMDIAQLISFIPYYEGNYELNFISSNSSGVHDPVTNKGRYLYVYDFTEQYFRRIDLQNNVIEPWTFLPIPLPTGATPTFGKKLASTHFQDGATKIAFIMKGHSGTSNMFQLLVPP